MLLSTWSTSSFFIELHWIGLGQARERSLSGSDRGVLLIMSPALPMAERPVYCDDIIVIAVGLFLALFIYAPG